MTIDAKTLIGLEVETQSGQQLGKVSNVEINAQTHTVERYEVQTQRSITEPFGRHLLIGPEQVMSITNEKMVVEDLLLKEPGRVSSAPETAPL